MDNKSPANTIVEHTFSCDECRKITREMLLEDREINFLKFREIIQEELLTSKEIKDRVSRLENIQSWLIVVCLAQTLAIIYLFSRIL